MVDVGLGTEWRSVQVVERRCPRSHAVGVDPGRARVPTLSIPSSSGRSLAAPNLLTVGIGVGWGLQEPRRPGTRRWAGGPGRQPQPMVLGYSPICCQLAGRMSEK